MSADANPWVLHEEPYRHYKFNGKRKTRKGGPHILSVTKVLDGDTQKLIDWNVGLAFAAAEADGARLGVGQRALEMGTHPYSIKDRAAARGHAVHAMMDRIAKGHPSSTPGLDSDYGLWQSLLAFIRKEQPGWRESERAVGSELHAYAGTYDAVVALPGRGRVRIDGKSTNTAQPKHAYQVAAYEEAAIECGEKPTDDQAVLYLEPMGNYRLAFLSEIPGLGGYAGALAGFHHYLALARLANAVKMPGIAEPLPDYSIEEFFANAHRRPTT